MRILRDNGLSIVLGLASLLTIVGMALTGWYAQDSELAPHGGTAGTFGTYLLSGHFLSALFENWESEFLQMAAYVGLTAFLFQRGSSESKDPDEPDRSDEDLKAARRDSKAPWPVRRGGLALALYSYSLGIALAVLFVLSFLGHLDHSTRDANDLALRHGEPAVTVLQHLASAQFWFESLQNWQSEFLSTGVIVVFSIFLRFRGSPESKPVAAPHHQTG